jgi:hypothetical protein
MVGRVAVLGAAMGLLLQASARAQEVSPLLTSSADHVHIFPTVEKAAGLATIGTSGPALAYNGGPVMTKANTYAIFWAPPTLQTGTATSMPAHYQNVQTALLSLYPGHGIDNNNTQYYMTQRVGFFYFTSYVQNAGGLAGSYVDTSAYPASGCTDGATPGNCISDAQIQAEIQKVMTLKGWTGGLNHMFLLYTSSGEGSCDPYNDCAYEQMCAYHGYFFSGTTPVIYADVPFGNTSVCQVPGTPSPNGDPAADTAATAASHELTEAITDPELNAWHEPAYPYAEIGDLCAYNYGPNTWASGKANQFWDISNGIYIIGQGPVNYFELQQEYDNHTSSCVQVGP